MMNKLRKESDRQILRKLEKEKELLQEIIVQITSELI